MSIQLERSFLGKPHRSSEQEQFVDRPGADPKPNYGTAKIL